jgi:hypothetical protein
MKKAKWIGKALGLTLLGALAQASSACAQSPMFNHETEAPDPGGGQSENTRVHNPSVASDCPLSFPKSGLCAEMIWTKKPVGDETGSFELNFWSATDGTRNGPFAEPAATAAVKLWMPAMGHGSSPVKISHKSEPGQFEGDDVFFVMRGAWEIHFQLKNGSALVEEAVLPIQI